MVHQDNAFGLSINLTLCILLCACSWQTLSQRYTNPDHRRLASLVLARSGRDLWSARCLAWVEK